MATSAKYLRWAWLKRLLDSLLAVLLLCFSLPLGCLVGLAILVTDGLPMLFLQKRAGKHVRPFTIIKFRTMTTSSPQHVTRLGPYLRRYGLDELPQLVNVLRGEMSIVGPRPCLPHQAARMSPRQQHRFMMRPGITGWAQIHGRWAIPWDERVELDLWYIENWSLTLDCYILYLSVVALFSTHGLIPPS